MNKLLFVSGLYNCRFFKTNVEESFEKIGYKIKFIECKMLKQKDIDKVDIIIGYSFAIQYINKLNIIKGKRIILVNPLLNDKYIKNWLLKLANRYIKWRGKFGLDIKIVYKIFGCNKCTEELWARDMFEWLNKYGIDEHIENIEPKKSWIILEGKRPICKLKRIDGRVYDNKGKLCNHFINFDNDWKFIKKWLKVKKDIKTVRKNEKKD